MSVLVLLGGSPAIAKPWQGAPAAARAVEPVPASTVDADSPPERPTMLAASLQSFMPQPKPIQLRGANGQEDLALPIARRLRITRAVLHLVATNSASLIAPRSQLQVRLDGQVVAQIALDPKLPQVEASISLPVRLLQPGYRTLTFAVAQHYTNDCEDPSAPELWTQVDTARSWIELSGGLRDIQPTLAALPDIFDSKLWGPHRLTVIGTGDIDDAMLRWGALAAQAVALRLEYAPLTVRYAEAGAPDPGAADEAPLRLDPARTPQGDAVLIGTLAQLRPYLSPQLAARIVGPFLAIVPLDAARHRYVLVASGLDARQVDTALRAASFLNYPYPDAPSAVVREITLPQLPDDPGPRMVYPNQKVAFSSLGFHTVNFSGMYGQRSVEFALPPDLFAPDNSMVHIKLRFAYGAALREDSVLNILLNGRFQSAIALSGRDGGYFHDYDVAIPLTAFKPGANVLTFSALMMPLVTGRCIAINTGNLQLTLYDSSRIEMPNAAGMVSLPDLNLLQRTGFPYTRKPFGVDSVVALTSAEAASSASAWMLVAKLAQINKLPLLDMRWQIGTDHLDQANAIVVGAADSLPAILADALPLRLGELSQAPYPVAVSSVRDGEIGPLEQLWRWLADKFSLVRTMPAPNAAWMTQAGRSLGRQAALMQAELPSRSRGTLTVLTAARSADLEQQTDALVHPAVWSQLGGDLVLWQGDTQIASQMVGPRYTVGEAALSSRIGFLLSLHPWFWAVVIGIVTLLLAATTLRLLMRFKHRRHGRIEENGDSPPTPA